MIESIVEKPKPRRNRCPHCGKFIKRQEERSDLMLQLALIGAGILIGAAIGYFVAARPLPLTNFIDRLI